MVWVREESFEQGFACNGEVATVRMTRDGILEMEGYDWEHEQALMEFYRMEPSQCYDMCSRWDASPAYIILKYFNVLDYDACRLALDWAEHTSWMIRGAGLTVEYGRIRRAFHEARELIDIREKVYTNYKDDFRAAPFDMSARYTAIVNNIKYIGAYFRGSSECNTSNKATKAMSYGIGAVVEASRGTHGQAYTRFMIIEDSRSAAKLAVEAAEAAKSGGAQREKRWQVRRFIDVMSAKKHYQPWPPLKWTK
jgi:hypothetical protein